MCPAIEKQSEDFSRKKVQAGRDPFDLPPRRDVSNRNASDSSATGSGWSVYDVGKVRRGSFLDRVAEMIHVGYMRRRHYVGYNNEAIPVWKDLTDQVGCSLLLLLLLLYFVIALTHRIPAAHALSCGRTDATSALKRRRKLMMSRLWGAFVFCLCGCWLVGVLQLHFSGQERQNDLGFVLMAVEVFLDPDMAARRRKSEAASQAAAAYRRLYKTELKVSIYAFAELDDAQVRIPKDP